MVGGKNMIQRILEADAKVGNYKSVILENLENYRIEDMVIGFNENSVFELEDGYFVCEESFDDVNEALDKIDFSNQIMRIIENKEFEIGCFYSSIVNCPEDKEIFDIQYLSHI